MFCPKIYKINQAEENVILALDFRSNSAGKTTLRLILKRKALFYDHTHTSSKKIYISLPPEKKGENKLVILIIKWTEGLHTFTYSPLGGVVSLRKYHKL